MRSVPILKAGVGNHLFLQIKFYWNTAILRHVCVSMTAFALQWQRIVVTETVWPAKFKYLLSVPLEEKFGDPCLRGLMQ